MLKKFFLSKCTALDKQFGNLLSDTLQSQVEDFFLEHASIIKDMNEVQFLNFILNESYGGSYDDLIRYVILEIMLMLECVK
jgi:hypothetical protein